MCNRYAHKIPRDEWVAHFGVDPPLELPRSQFERYNVAPSQTVPAVIEQRRKREFALLTWGFALNAKASSLHFNARSETAVQSYTFGAAFQTQRCILPASGFYEWEPTGAKPQPWYFDAADGTPLALGAILNGETVAILTTSANKTVGRLHQRMPLLLRPEQFDRWLEPKPLGPEELWSICTPAPEGYLSMRAVSLSLNNARNEGPELHKPPSQLQGDLFAN